MAKIKYESGMYISQSGGLTSDSDKAKNYREDVVDVVVNHYKAEGQPVKAEK